MEHFSGLPQGKTALLRVELLGLQIDVECVEGKVVDVTIGAQQKHPSMVGRLRQKITHALVYLARVCDARHKFGPVRVLEAVVSPQMAHDNLPNGREAYVAFIQRLASKDALGQTHYQTLLLKEGVIHGTERALARFGINKGGGVGADDAGQGHASKVTRSQMGASAPKLMVFPSTKGVNP